MSQKSPWNARGRLITCITAQYMNIFGYRVRFQNPWRDSGAYTWVGVSLTAESPGDSFILSPLFFVFAHCNRRQD